MRRFSSVSCWISARRRWISSLETGDCSVSSAARRKRRRWFSRSSSSVNSLPLLNSSRNFSARDSSDIGGPGEKSSTLGPSLAHAKTANGGGNVLQREGLLDRAGLDGLAGHAEDDGALGGLGDRLAAALEVRRGS